MIDTDKVLTAVKEKLNSMTESERHDYLIKMGFDMSDESDYGLTDLLMDAESIMSYIDEDTLKYFEGRGLRIIPDHGWWINLCYHDAVSKGFIDEQVLSWEDFKQLTLAKLSDGGYMQKLSYDDVYLLIDLFRKASEKKRGEQGEQDADYSYR